MTVEEFDTTGWHKGMTCRVASLDSDGKAKVRLAKILGVRFAPRVLFVKTPDGVCKSVPPADVILNR